MHRNVQFQFSVRSSVDGLEKVQTTPHLLKWNISRIWSIYSDWCGLHLSWATRLQTAFQGLCKHSYRFSTESFIHFGMNHYGFDLQQTLATIRKYESVLHRRSARKMLLLLKPLLQFTCHHTSELHIRPECLRRTTQRNNDRNQHIPQERCRKREWRSPSGVRNLQH